MTPEEAQDLLDKIKGTDAAALQAHMDWKDVSVALTTIAEMRYEYAVQFKHRYVWQYENEYYTDEEDQDLFSDDPMRACWWESAEKARFWADTVRVPSRVMARLVSPVEVVK